ncbi:MAG: hypothetical protein AAB425_08800, partial [Bdellovibrionota bacterium]
MRVGSLSLYSILPVLFSATLAGCRAGGDLKNEDHYVALEAAEIAAEVAAATPAVAPTPSASPSTTATTAGPPYALVVTTTAATIASATCAGPLTITLTDQKSQTTLADVGYPIALQDTLGGSFYGASSCATVITSTSVAVGSSAAIVYFKSSVSGNSTVSASNNNLVPGTLALTVTPGTVASISLAFGASSTGVAGGCNALTYSFYDSNGNLSPLDTSRVVSFQSSDALGKVH